MNFKETKIGIIPEHWSLATIKDATEVVTDYVANGSFASLAQNVTYKDEEDYAVLIRLVDYNNSFTGNFVFIDKEAYDFLSKSKLFGGEIIISNVGANVGTVFRCPRLKYRMSLAPNSIMVKFKENNDFYYHWLKSYNGQKSLQSIITGSAQPKFNKTNFRELVVPVPPIDEQDKIAALLNSIDKKIERNNTINNNLQQQAEAIFKDQFVDFSSTNGRAPLMWKKCRLADFLPVITGKKNANVSSDKGLYPFFSCSQDIAWTDEYSFDANAILVAGNGDFNVKWYNGKFEAYQRTYVLIPYNPRYTAWLFYAIKYSLNKITSAARGSVIKFITKGNLEDFTFYAPIDLQSFDVIDTFTKINETIDAITQENYRLVAIRDALLPKLISGEIDVSDVEI